MANNLSAAATKTLRTFAAVAHIDCYAGTKGIDCRTLKALVRKGLLAKVDGGYDRHAITPAGRAAIAPVAAPATPARKVNADGVIILTTGKVNYIDDQGFSIDLDNKGLRTGLRSNWTR
jgi:hypothetical protein